MNPESMRMRSVALRAKLDQVRAGNDDQLVASASAAGLSGREARRLISLAVQAGLLGTERYDGRNAPRIFARIGDGDIAEDLPEDIADDDVDGTEEDGE